MARNSVLSRWIQLSVVGFVLGSAYFVALSISTTGYSWVWIGFALIVCFIILLFLEKIAYPQALLCLLFISVVIFTHFVNQHLAILFVVICLLAIERLSKSSAILWVGTSIIAVFVGELAIVRDTANWQDAFVNSFLVLFISCISMLRKEAEREKLKSLELMKELDKKNKQLQKYSADRDNRLRLEERQYLSRELHDTLGHKLTTSLVQLEAAARLIELDPARTASIIDTIRNLLKEGLSETRDIVRLIDNDSNLSFIESIEKLIDGFTLSTGLSISVRLDVIESEISEIHQQHLLRIIQEALTNIVRHAKATEVTISLTMEDFIRLAVCDNGTVLERLKEENLPDVKSVKSRSAELSGRAVLLREGNLTKLIVEIPVKGNLTHHVN